MKLWEGLEQDLNYNAMVSQRGCSTSITPTPSATPLRGAAMRCASRRRCRAAWIGAGVARCPFLIFDNARFPIRAGLLQRRGGTARHDAVVWGYARAAERRGVDIVQNCEVTGMCLAAAGRRRRDIARVYPRRKGRIGGCRQQLAARGNGGAPPADREPCAAGLCDRRD